MEAGKFEGGFIFEPPSTPWEGGGTGCDGATCIGISGLGADIGGNPWHWRLGGVLFAFDLGTGIPENV